MNPVGLEAREKKFKRGVFLLAGVEPDVTATVDPAGLQLGTDGQLLAAMSAFERTPETAVLR